MGGLPPDGRRSRGRLHDLVRRRLSEEGCGDLLEQDRRVSYARLFRRAVKRMTREAPVHIVPYDRLWPDQFEQERHLLAGIIGEWLHGGIEHVGSTAVPG